jgi:hypothetical protein
MKNNSKRVLCWSVKYAAFILIISLISVARAADKITDVAEFSALRAEYEKRFPQKITWSRVLVSRYGLREEPLDRRGVTAGGGTTVIFNAVEKQTWMLQPARKIFVHLPAADEPGVTEVDDAPDSLLSILPCESYRESHRAGNEQYADRLMEKWLCRQKPSDPATTQLYDPGLKMVVRSESPSGHIAELRNIKLEAHPKEQFWPPSGYRKTSMKEYFTGIVELPAYQEESQSAPPDRSKRATQ